MSYPWWRFLVTFRDGHAEEFVATGLTPTDAMRQLLDDLGTWDQLGEVCQEHGDVSKVEYKNCETPGVED